MMMTFRRASICGASRVCCGCAGTAPGLSISGSPTIISSLANYKAPSMNDENIYWLFSSAAQSIATFVAFLLAGYTLVHAMMESVQQRDDTLEEIHSALIRQYYRQIKSLAIITGVAVLGSLAMLYLNGFVWPYKDVVVVLAAALDIAAIAWGIAFVIRIIDPDKYTNAAK